MSEWPTVQWLAAWQWFRIWHEAACLTERRGSRWLAQSGHVASLAYCKWRGCTAVGLNQNYNFIINSFSHEMFALWTNEWVKRVNCVYKIRFLKFIELMGRHVYVHRTALSDTVDLVCRLEFSLHGGVLNYCIYCIVSVSRILGLIPLYSFIN